MKKWFSIALLLLVCSCDVRKGNVSENESETEETNASNQITIPAFADLSWGRTYGEVSILEDNGNPIQFDPYENYESLVIPSFWMGLVLYDMYGDVLDYFDSICGGFDGSWEKVEQMTTELFVSCVSNNVETIEEYDRMVGIEIPDNLKQKLVKNLNGSFQYIINECEIREVDTGTRGRATYALLKEDGRIAGSDILTVAFGRGDGDNLRVYIEWTDDLYGF